jgi:trigger factor
MIVKNVEKKEKNIVTFVVEATPAEFEEAVSAAYQKNKKSIAIPGFRKGKAPRMVIEGMYGADIFYDDAFTAITPDAFAFAVEQENLKTVGTPSATDYQVGEDKGLTISFETAVYPEVKLGQYKGIEAPKAEVTATDAEVNDELERVRNRNSRLIVVDREAKNGDTTVIDFEGFLDGVPFDGGKGEGFELRLGSGQFVPGFEEQVVGMKAGDEKDIDITFPENYHEDLAGKAVVFKVKVSEVKETELPELDDEFAKDVSEFDTLEEYKNSLRSTILERNESVANGDFQNAVLQKAVENMECDIPDRMIDERQRQIVTDYSNNLRAQGYSLEQYLEMLGMDSASFQASARPNAVSQLQSEILLTAVADAEGITASDEELEEEYKTYAEMYSVEVQTVKTAFDPEILKEDIRRRKASQVILDSAVATAMPAEEPAAEEKPAEEKPAKKPAAKKTTKKKAAEGEEAAAEEKPAAKKTTRKKAAEPAEEPKAE